MGDLILGAIPYSGFISRVKTFANFAYLLLCAKILFANTVSFPDLNSPFVPRPCTYARPRFDTWKLVKYGVVQLLHAGCFCATEARWSSLAARESLATC